LDISTIEKYDTQKMFRIYDKWPEIARKVFESNQDPINYDNIEHIVFAGMGGSGAIGDMFSAILSEKKIHVNVVKGYVLPKTVNSNTLVIIVSVSGNSSETLALLNSAHKMKCRIIGFSSGGKVLEFCLKNKINHRIVTQHSSPRVSFTSYLYTILKVLHSTLKIKEEDIFESIIKLESTAKKINSLNLSQNNLALNLAEWIKGIPVIYYPHGLESVAIRFKNVLQENVKIHAITEDVLEASHNGIVAWEKNSSVQPIIIRGKDDHNKTIERWDIFKEYFKENNIDFKEIISMDGNIISKIINLIYILDYASIYLAIMMKTDPSPVKSIDFIKRRL
jgi:glucose/mannose-6-phosphate isomerase